MDYYMTAPVDSFKKRDNNKDIYKTQNQSNVQVSHFEYDEGEETQNTELAHIGQQEDATPAEQNQVPAPQPVVGQNPDGTPTPADNHILDHHEYSRKGEGKAKNPSEINRAKTLTGPDVFQSRVIQDATRDIESEINAQTAKLNMMDEQINSLLPSNENGSSRAQYEEGYTQFMTLKYDIVDMGKKRLKCNSDLKDYEIRVALLTKKVKQYDGIVKKLKSQLEKKFTTRRELHDEINIYQRQQKTLKIEKSTKKYEEVISEINKDLSTFSLNLLEKQKYEKELEGASTKYSQLKILNDQYNDRYNELYKKHTETIDMLKQSVEGENILKAYKLMHDKEGENDKLTRMNERKGKIREDVLAADVTELWDDDNQNYGYKVIYINGYLYANKAGKARTIDIDRAVQKQIIINGIRSKEIFKYINSENIMEYLQYDEEQGEFGQVVPENEDFLNEMCGFLLMVDGIKKGIVNIGKFIGTTLGSGIGGFLGIDRIVNAVKAGKKIDVSKSEGQAFAASTAALTMASAASFGTSLIVAKSLKAAGLARECASKWGKSLTGTSVAGLELFKGSTLNILDGATNLLSAVVGAVEFGVNYSDEKRMEDVAIGQKVRGNIGNSRLLGNAAVEKSIAKISGAIDVGKAALSTILACTGLGGMALSGLVTVGAIAAKKLTGFLKRKARKKEVLFSPEVLGGIKYDKNIVSDKMFGDILTKEIGITSLDGLYDAIRITDAINLHRNARLVAKKGIEDMDTIQTMIGLGYADQSKYGEIKLQNILVKTGYDGDWKEGLQHAILKKGIDYDTSWTRFVRGLWGHGYYRDKEADRLYEEGFITESQRYNLKQEAFQYTVNTAYNTVWKPSWANSSSNVGSIQPG